MTDNEKGQLAGLIFMLCGTVLALGLALGLALSAIVALLCFAFKMLH